MFSGANFFASGFGSGLLPISGTFGSLVGIGIYLLLITLGLSQLVIFAITVWFLLLGFYFCHDCGIYLGKADHSIIVWDEIVGMLLVLALMPNFQENRLSPIAIVLAFLAFRFFDIFKLPPASYADKHWHNGVGVMLDDVFAALYAILLMWSLSYINMIN